MIKHEKHPICQDCATEVRFRSIENIAIRPCPAAGNILNNHALIPGRKPEREVAPPAANTLLGVILMAAAMLIIPAVDGIAKHLSSSHTPYFIAFARYAVASLFVLPLSLVLHGRNFLPRPPRGTHLLRTLFLILAMTCYIFALARIEMATAISAFFIGPLVATLLAVAFFKERITSRKVFSLGLGFAGALIILRPDTTLDPGVLFALASGTFFGFYMVTTRLAARASDPIRTLAFQSLVGAALLLPAAAFAWPATNVDGASSLLAEWPLLLALGAFSATSHLLSITAFRYAETSTLAPLVYLELIATTAIGFQFFNELPGSTIWIGAAAIIAGGLLVMRRNPS